MRPSADTRDTLDRESSVNIWDSQLFLLDLLILYRNICPIGCRSYVMFRI